MLAKFVLAAALAGGAMAAASSASAMPVDRDAVAGVAKPATDVRYVCNRYRRCWWVGPRYVRPRVYGPGFYGPGFYFGFGPGYYGPRYHGPRCVWRNGRRWC